MKTTNEKTSIGDVKNVGYSREPGTNGPYRYTVAENVSHKFN